MLRVNPCCNDCRCSLKSRTPTSVLPSIRHLPNYSPSWIKPKALEVRVERSSATRSFPRSYPKPAMWNSNHFSGPFLNFLMRWAVWKPVFESKMSDL